MTFGKLIEGTLHLCPTFGADGQGRIHTNLPLYYEHASDRDGWMEVVFTDPPDGNYDASYSVVNGKIVQSWTEVEEDETEDVQTQIDRMQSQIDYLAMMSDIEFGGGIE